MIQTEGEIFSPEFLSQLRCEVSNRVKTSKAVLEAMKNLSTLNEENKVKIISLEQQIVHLKEENSLLAELLQSIKEKHQIENEGRQKRIEEMAKRQEELKIENQILKREVEKLKLSCVTVDKLTEQKIEPSQIEEKVNQNEDEVKKSDQLIKEVINQGYSSFDLGIYLKSQESNQQESQYGTSFRSEEKGRKQKNNMYKSVQIEKCEKSTQEEIYTKILYPNEEKSSIISQ